MARSSFLLLTLSALLTACGGGGGAGPSPVSTERFERLSGGDVRDNTTGIVWAGQLGGDLTNGYTEPTAAELFQLTDLGENTLKPHFSFLFPDAGLSIKAADPVTGLDNHVWAVDFGDAALGGLMARSSVSTPDYFRWRIKRPAGPSPVDVTYARGSLLSSLITSNNLTWKVCAEGLTFNGGLCEGTPTRATHAQALQLAEASTFQNFTDWRLPTQKELRALLQLRSNVNNSLTNAPLLPSAFGTHTGRPAYWTAGIVSYSSGGQSYPGAWQVDFSGVPELGGLSVAPVEETAHIRLVRSN